MSNWEETCKLRMLWPRDGTPARLQQLWRLEILRLEIGVLGSSWEYEWRDIEVVQEDEIAGDGV